MLLVGEFSSNALRDAAFLVVAKARKLVKGPKRLMTDFVHYVCSRTVIAMKRAAIALAVAYGSTASAFLAPPPSLSRQSVTARSRSVMRMSVDNKPLSKIEALKVSLSPKEQ
jgi:hypothetical protein